MTPDEDGDGQFPRCQFCDRTFPSEHIRYLHEGREHYERLPQDHRSVVEEAYQRESLELRKFQLRALLGLICLYFGLLLLYAVFA